MSLFFSSSSRTSKSSSQATHSSRGHNSHHSGSGVGNGSVPSSPGPSSSSPRTSSPPSTISEIGPRTPISSPSPLRTPKTTRTRVIGTGTGPEHRYKSAFTRSPNETDPRTRRPSTLRASVFDAFAQLGGFEENSQIAAWIFDPDADIPHDYTTATHSPTSGVGPKRENVRFLEKSGSRFRERLGSDASVNLLKMGGYLSPPLRSPRHSSGPVSSTVVPTRRPARRFFDGLRARSASRNREERKRNGNRDVAAVIVAGNDVGIPTSSPKKRPFLGFRSKSPRTIPISAPQSQPQSASLDIPRRRYPIVGSSSGLAASPLPSPRSDIGVERSLGGQGHVSNPSIASWVHVHGSSPSLDLLRNADLASSEGYNPFLHGGSMKKVRDSNASTSMRRPRSAGVESGGGARGDDDDGGIPFPRRKDSITSSQQIFGRLSSAVFRTFSISGNPSSGTLRGNPASRSSGGGGSGGFSSIRRTQSRPPETTEAQANRRGTMTTMMSSSLMSSPLHHKTRPSFVQSVSTAGADDVLDHGHGMSPVEAEIVTERVLSTMELM